MSNQGLTALLSHVIDYQKTLERMSKINPEVAGASAFKKKLAFLSKYSYLHPDFSQVQEHYQQADAKFQQVISQALKANQKRITEMESVYYKNSELIAQQYLTKPCDLDLSKPWPSSDLTKNLVQNKCQSHSSWTFPGLIFRPQVCTFLRSMVACDPLYLCDHPQPIDHIKPVISLFPDEYQQRLRLYAIDQDQTSWLGHLPQMNFGFIAAFKFFNTKNLQDMSKYFKEIYDLLRPGGIFGFSFNDCDHSYEISLVEKKLECYTPGHKVKQLLKEQGFYVILEHRDIAGSSWWEAQRPGEISSLRGSQTLAKIINI